SMTAHATVSGFDNRLADWPRVEKEAEKIRHVEGAAPYVEGEAMLASGGQLTGAMVRGVLPDQEPRVDQVGEKMLQGRLDDLKPGKYGIILGSELARALHVGVGDKVVVMTSEGNVTPAGFIPRLRRFSVVGIFEVGMYEYDRNLAFIDMGDAQKLYRLDDKVTGVRLRLDDMFLAPRVSQELVNRMHGAYYVTDWTRQHANFFRAIRTEKTVMFVILFLIVAVAAFNIVSTLVMVVNDKQSDIAILRTLGATPRSIMSVFMIQGTVIGAVGTLVGVACGVALSLNVETIVPWIEHTFHVQFLPADVYYISDLPSDLHWIQVGHIAVISFVLSLVSTIYPAWRAARTQPAEALRYE
ncbi:MAG: lipoprotein-releasing ABC transporter permease subunit, partial [Gammaproteobacteria bacterium]